MDFPFPQPYPKQTLDSFPSPPHDSFSCPFSVGSLDLPTAHVGGSNPPLTTHVGSPYPYETSLTVGYSSADTCGPNPFARGPAVHGFGLDMPLSRPDRAFKWRQVDPFPSDNPNQPPSTPENMQAFSIAEVTSASTWPEDDGRFWSAEPAASGRHSTELMAGDRHATETQTQTQTQAQSQTLSRMYLDEMMAALASRTHPAKLAVDMQGTLHSSAPVSSPQELQHRLESTGSAITRYTDWYRPQQLQNQLEPTGSPVVKNTDWYRHGTSPAATAMTPPEEEQGLHSLGAKLTSNGFEGYDNAGTGAQGSLAPGRAVGDWSGLSWADQPSAGTCEPGVRKRLDTIEASNCMRVSRMALCLQMHFRFEA